MTVLPLERYELFHTADLDDAREIVGRVFVPHRLDLVGGFTQLDARMHTRRLVRVAANYVSYGADVLVEPGELGSFFVVMVPLSGHSMIRCGNEEIYTLPGRASVVSPTEPLTMRWSADCACLILRLERPALEAHLRDLIGMPLHKPVRFDLEMDISKGYGRTWAGGLHTLIEELDRADGSLINNRIAAIEFEDWLMTGLLMAQRHNYSAILEGATRAMAPSRAVAIARELIENHPEWDHTVGSLAEAANVGVRALQVAFASHLDVSPKEYLTRVRMQRAHDELRALHSDSVTVNQVVAKWGLGHPGRFAAAYKKRFGELPSETLRK
jgi:AraC-like DNA-binding protein